MMRALPALLVVVSVACGEGRSGPTLPTPLTAAGGGGMSQAVRTHLEELMSRMQADSINRLTIDWVSFRQRVLEAAAGAQTIDGTFPAIRLALTLLADGHSSYRSALGTVIFVANRSCSGSGGPGAGALPDSIGYVSVGSFSGTSAEALAFADRIQSAIRAADRDGLIGWIVDLRGNGGGNMWPMIAGLGPILGDGVLGYFINPVGVETPWEYRGNGSFSGGVLAQPVSAPYRLRRERPRVAVITDNAVASSGEATAIAFRRRPDTRSFGVGTCGLSTANANFPLADGASVNLTVAVMADRARARYGDRVEPDEVVNGRDEVIARAAAWLQDGR